jgi:primosomal protein N' (replication factor Y)
VTGARRAAALAKAHEAASLIISTPLFSFTPLQNLGHICIERAGAGGYKLPKRPYLDMRIALLELARAYGIPLSYGDFPLPLELRADARKLIGAASISIMDTRKDAGTKKDATATEEEKKPWSAVPDPLRARLSEVLAAGGRAAVLAVRKGYAPVVVCRDCGQALRDERGAVYAFTQEGGERRFRTSDGVSVLGTKMTCPKCASWNLLPLGVGVERVVEELAKLFPESRIVQFDADSARAAAGAKKQLAPLTEPGSIVVGTEAMVPWLLAAAPEPIDLAAIASADSLLALPFWRARERFVRLAHLLGAVASEVIIATRLPDDTAMALLRDPSDTSFFDEEISLRAALGYPPSGTLISFSFTGSASVLDRLEAEVRAAISDPKAADRKPRNAGNSPAAPGSRLRTVADRLVRGSVYRRTLVLMLPKDGWPDARLAASISSLPPSVRVLIDPESFW